MSKEKIKVFVDGEVLVLDHFSGIGHYTAALMKEVDSLLEEDKFSHISIEIGLPSKLHNRIHKFNYRNFTYRKMPVSPRIVNGLKNRGLLPPIDLFYGRKKVYVFPHFSSWPTISSKQIPVIYDLSFIKFPQFSAEKNQQFLVKQTKLSIERAARVITISKNSKKEISDEYDFDKSSIDIITPLLDKNKFNERSRKEINEIKAKYSLFDDYILFVGNIEPRKNLVSLLSAYEQLDPKIQEKYSLLLIGAKGWRDDEIHTQIDRMKKKGLQIIQPSAYVEDDDLPALFSGASVFAYVSVYEGYGIPPTEAMACGTAVICSNNSSLPEAVDNSAYMVEALDIDAITKGLKSILSNKKLSDELKKKGLDRVNRLKPVDSARDFLNSIIKSTEQ